MPGSKPVTRCKQSPRGAEPPRCGPTPEGRHGPTNSHAGRPSRHKVPQGAPGSHSQDTASGTTPTWPPAPGSVGCTLYNTLPKDFTPAPSIKRISLSNHTGPRRDGCRRPAPPSTLGLFYPGPGTLVSTSSHRAWSVSSIQHRPPAPAMDTHSRSCPG